MTWVLAAFLMTGLSRLLRQEGPAGVPKVERNMRLPASFSMARLQWMGRVNMHGF
jgi:hypothetical protein